MEGLWPYVQIYSTASLQLPHALAMSSSSSSDGIRASDDEMSYLVDHIILLLQVSFFMPSCPGDSPSYGSSIPASRSSLDSYDDYVDEYSYSVSGSSDGGSSSSSSLGHPEVMEQARRGLIPHYHLS